MKSNDPDYDYENDRFISTLSEDQELQLRRTAELILGGGKGLLAADESTETMGKRLANFGIENNEANRRQYRQTLFTTPNIQDYVSGVILFEETVDQKTDEGVSFLDVLKKAGLQIGIKLDRGLVPLPNSKEKISKGLDDLASRVALFRTKGCSFAKWRSVYKISSSTPSELAMRKNAEILAHYAKVAQEGGLMPIIEPEVLPDGNHSLLKAQNVTERVLAHLYKALNDYSVYLEGTVLKINMVRPGRDAAATSENSQIAVATVTALRRTVPVAVPGIAFLSHGQTEVEATLNLMAITNVSLFKPWKLTFSFGRALQTTALREWQQRNREAAQQAFFERAKANSDAIKITS